MYSQVTIEGVNNVTLTMSDIIQIIGIIATAITSIIAIIISVKTLKQNSKMIEETTRPSINIYISATQFSQPIMYLVIKNFGNSSATITSFKCDTNLSLYTYTPNAIPLKNIVGTSLSPNQKLIYPLKFHNDNNEIIKKANIKFSYKSIKKTYFENISLNFEAYYNELSLRIFNKDEPIKSLSYAIQDISEKML